MAIIQRWAATRDSQIDVGVRGQHVDVVLTQWVDDDGLAPVNQVGCNLEDLRVKQRVIL